jgi:indole-3-glycerol phosphate synthase
VSFLDEVIAGQRRDIAQRKRRVPAAALRDQARVRPPSRDFAGALLRSRQLPAVIAEFKRASPSAGAISSGDVREVARAYERGGAAAISVLTEPRWFGGSLSDIAAARSASTLPVLRKDFIVDEYQVWESAAAGADALLLIVAALPSEQLRELRILTEHLGMHALVEVHDESEAQRAVASGAWIIGINNRDLRTLSVDRTTAKRLRPLLPQECVTVAESGYGDRSELAQCAEAGIDAVLVGESLMRASDRAEALRALRGASV